MMVQYIAAVDSVKLWVKTYGERNNEACLFINGAGANSSSWSEELCSGLAGNDFFVITYDHRDFGYSGKVNFETNPFDVMDLTKDAVGILDSLGIEYAHVIGQSMGGFITQILAIQYPDRLNYLDFFIHKFSKGAPSPTQNMGTFFGKQADGPSRAGPGRLSSCLGIFKRDGDV